MKRKLTILFSVIIVLTFLSYQFVKSHFSPIYNGQTQLSVLSEKGKIYYDDFGIPHIEAKNRSDLYKMYGYAVTQDRFFQIQFQKMIASGRLSEWFGSKTIDTDKTIRNIGIKHYMSNWYKRNQARLNPQLVADMESWLEGVNECIKTCPKPLELVLLNKSPEPIEVEDILAFSGVVAFSFSKAYFTDSLTTRLFKNLSTLEFEDFLGEKITVGDLFTKNIIPSIQPKSLFELDSQNILPHFDGSQSWVLSPQKSESGFATLANDPHIAFSNPGVWYEAHLKSEDFEIYGYFIPIIPFPLIGNNTDKAWALTMSYTDEIDLLQASDKSVFSERKETILVNKELPIEVTYQDTKIGPVINQLLKNEQNVIMSWDYYREDNFVIESFYDLAWAKTPHEFIQAIKKGRAPGLNVSWADKNGNIAWRILGYFPKRKDFNWKIRNASSLDFENLDSLKNSVNDQMIPQIENPKSEYILSANQKPPFPFDEKAIHGYWESSERYNALDEELSTSEKISVKKQIDLFTLNNFYGAKQRLAKMIETIQTDSELVKMLLQWDGQADLDNTAQGFYLMWIDEIIKIAVKDHLNSLETEQLCSTSSYWKFATRIIDNKDSKWWKNNYNGILQLAFASTHKNMTTQFGTFKNWNWGRLHTVTYEHPLGKVPALKKLFNLGPYPAAGGFLVPNAFRHKLCSGNFDVTSGASTRRLVDFKDPKETLGVLPTGNSGSLFSQHYDDQVKMFLKGEMRKQTLDWDKIELFPNVLELNP